VRYRIEISETAIEQLGALPKDLRRNIGQRMEILRENLQGDVVKLKAQGNRYRLRVGSHRVLFSLAGDAIQILLSKTERKLMSDSPVMERIEKLTATVARLEERVEDLEDLRDLEEAIAENGGKPLIAWEKAKAGLDLE
jgi:mRNA-degrading endonuclease RelE of RelBE toxin-antitoxin system